MDRMIKLQILSSEIRTVHGHPSTLTIVRAGESTEITNLLKKSTEAYVGAS